MFRRLLVCLSLVCVLFVVPCFAYEDRPPEDAPFVGSAYISCVSDALGAIDVYLPITYRVGFFGVDGTGNLFNVSNTSISGVLYTAAGREYQFRCQSWSAPQYRDQNGNDHTYYDLEITDILSSNVQIADSFPPLVEDSTLFNYAYLMIGGVIILCLFLKRF